MLDHVSGIFRTIAYMYAGIHSIRCKLCNELCEAKDTRSASGEYDALADHLMLAHPEKHEEMKRRYESMI